MKFPKTHTYKYFKNIFKELSHYLQKTDFQFSSNHPQKHAHNQSKSIQTQSKSNYSLKKKKQNTKNEK